MDGDGEGEGEAEGDGEGDEDDDEMEEGSSCGRRREAAGVPVSRLSAGVCLDLPCALSGDGPMGQARRVC